MKSSKCILAFSVLAVTSSQTWTALPLVVHQLLYTSTGISSVSGALPEDRCWINFLFSMTVWYSSSRTLHSILSRLLKTSSLTDNGQLSTLLKYSAQLAKIASLSVRSELLSALRRGGGSRALFQCIILLLHILPVCKRRIFFLLCCQKPCMSLGLFWTTLQITQLNST